MPSPPLSWPQRFLRAVPHMPDGVWVGCLVLFVFLTGVIVGVLLCPQPSVTPTSVLQHRLDAVDARLLPWHAESLP